MTTSAEYRENATLCLQAMGAATAPEVKETLRSLAERWIDLAERAERGQGANAR